MVKIEDLLPIGSVVKIKNQDKRVMIFGVLQSEDGSTIYDYIGVPYPEGNSGESILFNCEEIEQTVFTGYVDEERDVFLNELQEEIENCDEEEALIKVANVLMYLYESKDSNNVVVINKSAMAEKLEIDEKEVSLVLDLLQDEKYIEFKILKRNQCKLTAFGIQTAEEIKAELEEDDE